MRPIIKISKEMIKDATLRAPSVAVNRTKASSYDTMYGILGEYCFAQWFVGTWISHSKLDTKGETDFFGKIEIKTSAFPFSEKLNLLVREDYARKRKPNYYVQTIINTPNPKYSSIEAGMECILAGFATSDEIDNAPLKDFGSKFGGSGGYRCRFISIEKLQPMHEFKDIYEKSNIL